MGTQMRVKRATKEYLTKVIHAMADSVMVLDRDGVITRANPATLELLQADKEEVVGRRLETFLDDSQNSELTDSLREGAQRFLNTVLRARTGRLVPVSVSLSPLREKGESTAMICVARDVTDARETRESLKRSEAQFRGVVDQAADAFFVLDREGRITDLNQAACDTLGYSREELLQAQIAGMELGFSSQQYETLWETLEPGAPMTLEGLHRRKDGSTFRVEMRVNLIDVDGYKRIFALVRDVTERQRVDLELVEAREAAIEASRLKSEFLANMSHEIRTPMNAVIGMTDLVLETKLSSVQQDYLQTVKSSAVSLLTIIDDILDFSKIEAGKLELEEVPFSLAACISDPLRTLSVRAHEKRLELVLDLQDDVPDAVIGDPGRIRQILINLLSNSIKFSENGRIVVKVRATQASSRIASFRISVSDSGVGIPRQKLETVFEAFAQADGSTTRHFGGTGLGLAICRKLTNAMGGRIWAESDSGEGSTFYVSLPLRIQEGAVSWRDPNTTEIYRQGVLIVDEDEAAVEDVSSRLRKRGMVPKSLSTVDELMPALSEAFQRNPSQLVLVDRRTAAGKLGAVVEEINSSPSLKDVPIVLVLGEADADAPALRELGIDGYVRKPFSTSELVKTIDAVTEEQEEQAEPLPERVDPSRRNRSLRILLAEDSPVNRRVLKLTLEKHGHFVVSVTNGREAVAAVSRESFDLVFMDVQMPVLDGFEATAQIRSQERHRGEQTPIIALTAHAMKGDRERCLAEGMDDYLAKPIQRRELWAIVERWGNCRSGTNEVLNEELLNIVTCGDKNLARELAALFLEESPTLRQRLQDAMTSSDAVAIEKAAHRLKGSLSTLGADRAADTAGRIEAAAKSDDTSLAETLVGPLEEALLELEIELSAMAESSSSVA